MKYIDFIPEEKQILKVGLLDSLAFFTRFFFKELKNETFDLNHHHEILFDGLRKVHNLEKNILIENIPPRHSKTEIIINFVAWSLAINPKCAFLIVSQNDTLAKDTSSRVRDILTSPIYKELFGVEIKQDTNAKGLWRTIQGGGIRSTSLESGGITGFGAGHLRDDKEFYGAILIDDSDKIGNISTVKETLASERFDDTIISRRNGNNTPIIIIQQRVSLLDLTEHIISGKSKLGKVIDNPRFLHISIPVVTDGEPLWPRRFGLDQIKQAQENIETGWLFEAQYQQNPTNPKGVLFSKDKLKHFSFKEIKEQNLRFAYIDSKDKGTDNYCMIIGDIIDNKVYILDVIHNNSGLETNKPYTIQKILKWGVQYVMIETNREGGLLLSNFKDYFKANPTPNKIRFTKIWNTVNKITRIIQLEETIKSKLYFLNEDEQSNEYRSYYKSLTTFSTTGKNASDDAPDATAGFAKLSIIHFKVK